MHRPPNFPAASSVVESPDERPEELNNSGEELAKISQDYKEQRDADDGVDDCSYST